MGFDHAKSLYLMKCAGTLHVAEDAPAYTSAAPALRTDGEVLRLAMSLVEGVRLSSADRAATHSKLKQVCANAAGVAFGQQMITDNATCTDSELGKRLMAIARQSDRLLSQQLELLVRFADAELYLKDGCRSMVQWMDVYLGMGRINAFEHMRVGRALRELPWCAALFSVGKLSFSKARVITRHATPATDEAFATATQELSASETEAWCDRYRHEQDVESIRAAENSEAQAMLMAFDKRGLRTRALDAHSTRITIDLPVDMAAEFLRSLEQCDELVLDEAREQRADQDATEAEDGTPSASQRHADAVVLMSRRSLAHAGEAVSMADRFRVNVTVNAETLMNQWEPEYPSSAGLVPKPMIDGRAPIASATVRRLAELAGYTAFVVDGEGDPVASRRVAAPFSRRQLRALRARDGCCQMPGCGATRHLDGHHVLPRAAGGESTLGNAVLLCSGCHRLLHEGNFRLERVSLVGACHASDKARTDTVRRYRLFDADGRECGSRGAALQRARSGEEFTRVNNVALSTRVKPFIRVNESSQRDSTKATSPGFFRASQQHVHGPGPAV